MIRRLGYSIAAPVASLVLALIFGAIVLQLTGADPWSAFSNVWEFGTRLETLVDTLNRGTALYLSGVAVAIGFKMNLFNIGVEGQYILAAIVAAEVGAKVGNLPPVIHVTLILVTAMTVGALWSGLAGVLKAYRNVNEVISTIMLNAIGVAGLVAFLLKKWDVPDALLDTKTQEIPRSGWMPSLTWVLELFTRDIAKELYGFLAVAVVVGILYHVLLNKTRIGYDLRATGWNPFAARAGGVDPKKTIILAMLLSGAVAGLVGLGDLLGKDHAYSLRFIQQRGFNGIAVALLGRNHPVGIAIGAFIFGWLEASGGVLQVKGDAPAEIVTILKGVIVLAAVIAYAVVERKRQAFETAAAAAAVAEREPEVVVAPTGSGDGTEAAQ